MFTRLIRRLFRSAGELLQLLVSIPQRIASAIATWFIRRAIRAKRGYRRSPQWANAGFVLPTAVLLTLVVALTVGALTFRTFSRTSDVITERQQRVIQNAATPAIDRAKAKIERLFEDSRYPGGVPSSDVLISMIKNETANGITALPDNPYIFPDETAVDTGSAALTWKFEDDAGHDIIYSITIDDETPDGSVSIASSDADKAANGVVRNGPISMQELRAACERSNFSREPEGGWYPVNTADVRRVFQVDAYVADENNGRVAALEFQQDRQVSRGNKWGAWFRTDLEVFPLPNFMWNGAMHTEGSIIAKDNIFAHLVSSPASCVYSKDASEITSAEYLAGDESNDETAYTGQFVFGVIGADNFTGSDSKFHLFSENGPITDGTSVFNANKDSVTGTSVSAISLNPTELFTNNKSVERGTGWNRDPAWDEDGTANNKLKVGRLDNSKVPIPFLDDTFRADNRFGPKPEYKDRNPDQYNLITIGEVIGDDIPSTRNDLLSLDGGEGTEFGLDGYWERRALVQGVRTIVGERLELGNTFGWQGADNALRNKTGDLNGDGVINASDADPTLLTPGYLTEPLYPSATAPTFSQTFGADNSSTFQQNRTLRDNLAAVQAMAVYRYSEGDLGRIPMACVAVTSHNGTQQANINSRTFGTVNIDGTDFVETNFLSGKGTNGWEFPFVATSESGFSSMIRPDEPMGRALRNLAHFAGDPNGGAPSFPHSQDNADTYPNDYMKMWGDFSTLRRILDSGVSYDNLSPADKSTLHTAACTISMLAYNLELQNQKIDGLDAEYAELQALLGNVNNFALEIYKLMDESGDEFFTGPATDPNKPAGAIAALHPGQAQYVPVAPSSWNDTINNSNPADPANYISTCTNDQLGVNRYSAACDAADYFQTLGRVDADGNPVPLTLKEIEAAVLTQVSAPQRAVFRQRFALLESFVNTTLAESFQVLRDRTLGFKYGAAPIPSTFYTSNLVNWNPDTGITGNVSNSNSISFGLKVGCDPDIFDKFLAQGNNSNNQGQSARMAALSLAFCNASVDTFKVPKYPSLYYLFPVVDHDLYGAATTGATAYNYNHTQPVSEEYIHNDYVQDSQGTTTLYTYKALKPGQDGLVGFNNIDIEAGLLALIGDGDNTFELTDSPAFADWELPHDPTPDANAPNIILEEEENASGAVTRTPLAAVPFMDHQYYDGRELMNLRMLAYDLSLLTGAGEGDFIRDDETVNDIGSVIYAFREDAVREDEIIRPSGQDPAITAANGISTKPVDFVADPGRRAHGFALIRGADLNRDNNAGMTFVTDNSVMIQGNFNLHSGNGEVSGIMEEFTDTLMADVNLGANGNATAYTTAFYGRTELNDDFAEPTQDHWRPVEILGDSVVFVSDGFLSSDPATSKAGTVDRGFVNNSGKSYRAMRYPDPVPNPAPVWYREGQILLNPSASTFNAERNALPIEFNRDGYPVFCSANATTCSRSDATNVYTTPFFVINAGNNANRIGQLPDAGPNNSRIYINATVVSGIVPSQAGQSNGGLHNFPRFVENWEDVDVVFAGAFFQLNFSTYATAPWDDNPGLGSTGGNFVSNFYSAPNRRWGYDVGLLYAPAGPVAQRFVTPSSNRSEFYRELPSNDPYIDRLRNLLAG